MMTGGFGNAGFTWAVATMSPVAGSMRSRVPLPNAYSEPSALTSEFWLNVWWLISSAPHGPPAIRVVGDACWVCDDVWDGEADADADADADEAGAPPAGDGELWWELASTAMPALAPAMTTTAAAARAGAQARLRPPRRGPGTRPRA